MVTETLRKICWEFDQEKLNFGLLSTVESRKMQKETHQLLNYSSSILSENETDSSIDGPYSRSPIVKSFPIISDFKKPSCIEIDIKDKLVHHNITSSKLILPLKLWTWLSEEDFLKDSITVLEGGKFSETKKAQFRDLTYCKANKRVPNIYADSMATLKHPLGTKENLLNDFYSLMFEFNSNLLLHPFLVNYIGVLTIKGIFGIGTVMEFFSITNLKQAIQTNPRLQEINNQLMIAKQIASGMNFLHSLNPCVLYPDLKSKNILVNENLECKLIELGLFENTESFSHSNYSKKGDIALFGFVLIELVLQRVLASGDNIRDVLLQDLKESNMKHSVINLILNCIEKSLEKRPSFREIQMELNRLLGIVLDPEIIVQLNTPLSSIQNKIEQTIISLYQVNLDGWLWKKGEGVLGLWKKRYFQLKTTRLYYYKFPNSTKPQGYIDLLKAFHAFEKPLQKDDSSKPLCFYIHVPNRVFSLQIIESNNDFAKWWDTLNQVFSILRNSFYQPDVYGRKLIHQYCMYGNLVGMKELISIYGKESLEYVDKFNMNCAHFAARNAHIDILKFLTDENKTKLFNEREKRFDMNPFTMAILMKHTNVIQFLLPYADLESINTGLILASQDGNLEVLQMLLERGANLNYVDPEMGISTLGWASFSGYFELVRFLVTQKGIDINLGKTDNTSPLFFACQQGHKEIIEIFIQSGADINKARNSDLATPLLIACQEGRKPIVQLLIQNGADINKATSDGCTPLFYAASRGHKDIVLLHNLDLLLKKEVDFNASRSDGATPLFMACQGGHKEIVESLLQKGANVNKPTNNETTPLFIACQQGYYEIVIILLRNGATLEPYPNHSSPLYVACQEGHLNIVKLLLRNGNDVNRANEEGITPLVIACNKGHKDIVEALLQNGADINLGTTSEGTTPLGISSQLGYVEIVTFLIQNGADVNLADKNDSTPLLISTYIDSLPIVEILIQNGADVNKANNNGCTPLFLACRKNSKNIVERLLQQKDIDLNKSLITTRTSPLLISCVKKKLDIVKLLLQYGTDVNKSRIIDGVTPLYYTSLTGMTEFVEVLLKDPQIDVNKACDNGNTPLLIACDKGHKQIIELLLKHNADVNKLHPLAGISPLHLACAKNFSEIVDLLLQYGANVNQTSERDGTTALITACQKENIIIAESLLKHGGDVNQAGSHDGVTPLYIACQKGSSEIVSLLINYGVDINKPIANDGTTALLIGTAFDQKLIVELLITKGADINKSRSQDGVTPLCIACQEGNVKLVELFLKHNVDVNKPKADGATPLFIACHQGHQVLVELLLQHNVDVNKARSSDGWTPLLIASQEGHVNIVKFLLLNIADVNRTDLKKQTPLMIAVQRGNFEIVKILLNNGADVTLKNSNQHTALDLAKMKNLSTIVKLLEEKLKNKSP